MIPSVTEGEGKKKKNKKRILKRVDQTVYGAHE